MGEDHPLPGGAKHGGPVRKGFELKGRSPSSWPSLRPARRPSTSRSPAAPQPSSPWASGPRGSQPSSAWTRRPSGGPWPGHAASLAEWAVASFGNLYSSPPQQPPPQRHRSCGLQGRLACLFPNQPLRLWPPPTTDSPAPPETDRAHGRDSARAKSRSVGFWPRDRRCPPLGSANRTARRTA